MMNVVVKISDANLTVDDYNSSDFTLWTPKGPTLEGWIVYSIIIPIICIFGICGNGISVNTLHKIRMNDSFFVYLKYLASVNLGSCIVMTITGFSKGLFYSSTVFNYVEEYVCLLLGNSFSYLGTCISVAFIFDRYCLIRKVISIRKPKLCSPIAANKCCLILMVVVTVASIPFIFISKMNENGSLKATQFYVSRQYYIISWVNFATFSLLPSILMTVGISFLLLALKRAIHIKNNCCKRTSKEDILIRKEQEKQLAVALFMIVFLFIVGEVPAQVVSRYMATSIIFKGNFNRAKSSKTLEVFRQITSILKAINVSSNFPLFCRFCPKFAEIIRDKIESARLWPRKTKNKKKCESMKCLEDGHCTCSFMFESLSSILVKNTVTPSFLIVKLKPTERVMKY